MSEVLKQQSSGKKECVLLRKPLTSQERGSWDGCAHHYRLLVLADTKARLEKLRQTSDVSLFACMDLTGKAVQKGVCLASRFTIPAWRSHTGQRQVLIASTSTHQHYWLSLSTAYTFSVQMAITHGLNSLVAHVIVDGQAFREYPDLNFTRPDWPFTSVYVQVNEPVKFRISCTISPAFGPKDIFFLFLLSIEETKHQYWTILITRSCNESYKINLQELASIQTRTDWEQAQDLFHLHPFDFGWHALSNESTRDADGE